MDNHWVPERRVSFPMGEKARKVLGVDETAFRRGSLPASANGQLRPVISLGDREVLVPNKALKLLGLPDANETRATTGIRQAPSAPQSPVYSERRYIKKNLLKPTKIKKWLSNLHLSPDDRDSVTENHPENASTGVPAIVIDCHSNDFEKSQEIEEDGPSVCLDEGLLSTCYTLDAAVARADCKLLEAILCSGCVKPTTLNASGGTAMHEAAFQGKISCLRVFLRFGVNIEIRDKEGWTPLHAAVCGGDIKCVEFLLRHGARTDAETEDGIRPVQIALQAGDRRIVQAISSANADRGVRRENRQRRAMDGNKMPQQKEWDTFYGSTRPSTEGVLPAKLNLERTHLKSTHEIGARNRIQPLAPHIAYF